jgi:hypothetical protein
MEDIVEIALEMRKLAESLFGAARDDWALGTVYFADGKPCVVYLPAERVIDIQLSRRAEWKRDSTAEFLQIMQVQIGLLNRVHEDMRKHPGQTHYPRDIDSYVEKLAREIVYTSPDNLNEYESVPK